MDEFGIYIMLYFILILMVEALVLFGLSGGVVRYCENPILAIVLIVLIVLNMLNYDMMRNHRHHLRPGLVGWTGLLDTNRILSPN
jgi:hypothetical protein